MAVITKPVAPGQQEETGTAVERIGVFAAAARPEHLTTDIRQLFKRNILDSIRARSPLFAGSSLRALREQIEEYRAPGRCTLIGGGKTSPIRQHSSTPRLCAMSTFSIATWHRWPLPSE